MSSDDGEAHTEKPMVVAVFGTSTTYAYWGFSVLGHVMDAIHSEHCRIHCLDLSGLNQGWQGRENKAVLITTDRPDVSLSILLTTSGFPCLAFIDDPADAIANAMRANGMSLHDAIRFSVQYFSCLGSAVPANGVRVFGSEYYKSTVSDFVSEILAAVVGSVPPAVKARVMERLASDAPLAPDVKVYDVIAQRTDGALLPGGVINQLSLDDRRLIFAISDAYRPIFDQVPLAAVEWPREMFSMELEVGASSSDIKLAGGARHIVWGPYLFLPAGGWRGKIQFEIVENNSGNEIEADICVGMKVVSRGQAVLPVQGYFECSLDFEVVDPNAPIEVRVRLMKGAIEGRFGLRKVVFEPISIPQRTELNLIGRERLDRLGAPLPS